MNFNTKKIISMAVAVVVSVPMAAWATNGMNLEAYGPIAGGMGGAAYAYDNGSAAMMSNPATIGLMKDGSRLDVAVGSLRPNITTSMTGQSDAASSATAFYMPAIGWVKKSGALVYGVGVFSQGGMGTEYGANSFLAAGTGEAVRSEVGVGRFMIPLSYTVNDKLNIAGSIDYVWAGMDLKMAMSGAQFGDMLAPAYGGTQTYGTASGSMVDTMMGMVGTVLDGSGPVNNARFDFSNNSAFTGEAFGSGFAGKLGFTYKVASRLTIGGSYQSKTAMGDLETNNAKVSMNVNMDQGLAGGEASTGFAPTLIPVSGKISVKNFEWPETYGIGAAFQATDKIMIAADIKRIGWASVMKSFEMGFVADTAQDNPLAAGFAGLDMDAVLFQNWEDQTVIALGASVQTTDTLVLRVGYNGSSNPVPNKYVNPLFPATIKSNYTVGAGYELSKVSAVNASVTYAPAVVVASGQGATISHSQMNWQVMYSQLF